MRQKFTKEYVDYVDYVNYVVKTKLVIMFFNYTSDCTL